MASVRSILAQGKPTHSCLRDPVPADACSTARGGPNCVDRPEPEGMNTLSVLLSAGQLLALPLVIYLVASRRYTLVPLGTAIVLVVHFAPYSWLYATPLYLIMGAAVAIEVTAAMGVEIRAKLPEEQRSVVQAGRASLVTGVVLTVSAVVALFL
ncbi:MAG: DUF7010 family protein [Canibacter sp.]